MNPIQVLLNIGKFINLVKDLEGLVADLVQHKVVGQDALDAIEDVRDILGVVQIPGIPLSEVDVALSELEKVFKA